MYQEICGIPFAKPFCSWIVKIWLVWHKKIKICLFSEKSLNSNKPTHNQGLNKILLAPITIKVYPQKTTSLSKFIYLARIANSFFVFLPIRQTNSTKSPKNLFTKGFIKIYTPFQFDPTIQPLWEYREYSSLHVQLTRYHAKLQQPFFPCFHLPMTIWRNLHVLILLP